MTGAALPGTTPAPAAPLSLLAVALGGRCPRCGARTLYAGLLRFAPACRACALDFTAFNVGDGPAAFLTLLLGGLVTALAIAVELGLSPPAWLHLLLWPPLLAAGTILSLRAGKAALLAAEYRNAAREGRIVARR